MIDRRNDDTLTKPIKELLLSVQVKILHLVHSVSRSKTGGQVFGACCPHSVQPVTDSF